MKICPQCLKRQNPTNLVACPDCKVAFVEESELLLRLSNDQLDHIANRVAKAFREEDLGRISGEVVKKWEEKHWKPLADQVLKSMNNFYHVKQIANTIITLSGFWKIAIPVVVVVASTAWGLTSCIAKKEARGLFYTTVTNRIEQEFKEPRISNIVVSVASTKALDILSNQVQPALTGFTNTLDAKIQETQTNLIEKIENSGYVLFANATNEYVHGSHSSRITIDPLTTNLFVAFFNLSHPIMPRTIQGWQQDPGLNVQSLLSLNSCNNIVWTRFNATNELPQRGFTFTYMVDKRATRKCKEVQVRPDGVYFDNVFVFSPAW